MENRLRDALRQDRARVQFGTISKFGLMEMSRQRLRPALSEGASIPCPRCGGSGHIRDTESSALQILRIIQEESLKDSTASVLCQVPVDVASFLLNEKRSEIAKIELKQRINVLLVPNKTLETPNYRLERLKHDDPRLDNIEASYKMAEEIEDPTTVTRRSQEQHQQAGTRSSRACCPMRRRRSRRPSPWPSHPQRPRRRPAPPVHVPAPRSGRKRPVRLDQEPVRHGGNASARASAGPAQEVKKDERPGRWRRVKAALPKDAANAQTVASAQSVAAVTAAGGGRSRGEGAPAEGRAEGRPEGRNGERRERTPPKARAEGGRPERAERQERPAGEARAENRHEGRSDNASEAQPRNEGQSREGRGERNRPRGDRPERAERPERGERIPRDAVEQDLALANQAAMAAAMGGEAAAPRQDRPAQDAGRDGERRQRRTCRRPSRRPR